MKSSAVSLRPIQKMLILSLAILFTCTACTTANRRVIKNPDLNHYERQRGRYINLFPAKYKLLEESEFDRIDFRQPHEKGVRKYAFLSDPRGDIDRTKGYDALEYTVAPDLSLLQSPASDVQITWIRHATVLIQLGKKYQILVDPVLESIDGLTGKFMKYADIGKLYAEPPLTTRQLPFFENSEDPGNKQINIVAVSHNHYDHLNWNTIDQLPLDTHFYVPLGLEDNFPSRYPKVTGMDWYTKDSIGGLTVYFVPATHWSGRSMHGPNRTLWGGWLFKWRNYSVYFAGDTGYSDGFKDIKARFGAIDICLMPISAYFQRHVHLTPEDAICAAQDLGCREFIPWGWGTWIISFEHILDPPRRLQYAWKEMKPKDMRLHLLNMGETVGFEKVAGKTLLVGSEALISTSDNTP
ncbi:MAG: MBL fold metallo-hydrolase [Desulfobacterales bacterium]|jgi:L-ascorbate metabolism protein UlaG (beta-lactamase superfamily)